MGFLSTLTTESHYIRWPQWFRVKYAQTIVFPAWDSAGPLGASSGHKTYTGVSVGAWVDLASDIQGAIPWGEFTLGRFVMVYLHECGGITRCQISPSAILWSEPNEWRMVDEPTHNYCLGCSDPPYEVWRPLSDPPTEAGVYLTRKAHGIPAVSPWRPEDGDVVEWWGRLGTVEWMRIPD